MEEEEPFFARAKSFSNTQFRKPVLLKTERKPKDI